MRLHRLALRHVRGVAEREVRLLDAAGDTGVTIVEGPNESGKSTLADALDALLTHKASSRHREVRSLQTQGLDEAPEVIAEISTGGYRFTYTKRYLTRPSTQLEIHAPRSETLSGDEAHDRVAAILDETIDRDLWEALRLPQGAGFTQAAVGGAAGLGAALERHAESSALGDRELALLELAREEYLRYFTDKGNERRQPLGEARERVEEEEAKLDEIDEKIAALSSEVERADAIERDLPRLRERAAQARERAGQLAAQRDQVEELRRAVAQRENDVAVARTKAERLAERLAARHALVERLAEAEEEQRQLSARRDEAERLLTQAKQRTERADAELAAVRERQRAARLARERAQADLDHLRSRDELAAVRRRLEQAETARDRRREAEARAEEHPVDDELLAELRAAQSELDRAQAALDAASPEVTFHATTATTVTHGDETLDLAAGDERQWTVHGALTLGIGEIGEVAIRSGAGTDEAANAQAAARRRHDEGLERAGASDLDAAEAAHRVRREALTEAAEAARDLERALDGETLDALGDRAARLARQVEAYLTERGEDSPLPGDVDEAQRLLDEALDAERAADAEVTDPQAEVQAARAAFEAQQQETIEIRASAAELQRRTATLSAELAEGREHLADEALAEQAETARRAQADAEATLAEAREQLDAADPETVVARADNAREVAERADAEVAEAEREQHGLRARIAALGGEGLHEQREDQAVRLTHARTELDSLQRRASASRLLYETLERHRAAAFERYAAPLREQMLRFGRMLHGADFDVELDDELRAARRRLDGVWLQVEQLSVGAREQLALLGRLAAAVLLADRGGVLLFDDALGNTDAERLESAGAALRLAGEHCQVVVLTCYPDRYRHVGGATRVVLT